ncbi:MAG: ABC transporter permease [Vicinamibacterales bacterium]
MASFLHDLRLAARTLLRAPGFAVIVVLTLGLGIGANAAIFSLTDQVLLRLLPVRNPSELVQLDGPGTFSGRTMNDRTFSYPTYVDLRDRNQVFAGLVARVPTPATFSLRGQAERIDAEIVSGNTFAVLGVSPVLGRPLTPEDDRVPGGHPVVVLGYGFWQRRFAGDPSVLNQVVTINETPMTVVGVAPAGFSGVVATAAPDVFVPMMMKAALTPTWDDLDNRRSRWVNIVGRLKPGLTAEQAKASLDVTYQQILAEELESVPAFAQASDTFHERYRAKTLVLLPAGRGLSTLREGVTTPLFVLMGMVGLVLLIACANVANLLLTRATARQREMAVRLALGASRRRLVGQMLAESLILAAGGGLAGLVFSIWLGDLLVGVLPFDGAIEAISTAPDLRVGLYTAGLSLVTALAFGLVPALQGSRLELNRTMRAEAGSVAAGGAPARFRKGLVIAQVALSMLLVAGAGLFAQSLYNLRHLDTGFDTAGLVSFSLDPSLNGYDQDGIRRFYDRLLTDIRALPGVQSASLGAIPLLTGNAASRTVDVQGYERKPDEDMNPWVNEVAPDYFRTMRTALVAGREFTETDIEGGRPVAIVNETFAHYFFGDESAIGRRFGWRGGADPGAIEIVGVVQDTFYAEMRQGSGGDHNDTPRMAFTPYRQGEELGEMTMYVRGAAGALGTLPNQLRETVRRADATIPVFDLQTVTDTMDRSLFTERILALLSAAFGLLATLLAAVGLYGVMAYTVSRRTREIGIRMALGAEHGRVLWLVLREVALLTGIGIVLGIPGALGLSRLVESQLFGVGAADPVTLAAAAATLAAVGLLAGYLPARRAARVEPLLALRYE